MSAINNNMTNVSNYQPQVEFDKSAKFDTEHFKSSGAKLSAKMLVGEKAASAMVAETTAKDSFVRSTWFKVCTLGIGWLATAIYDLVHDSEREDKAKALRNGAKGYYDALTVLDHESQGMKGDAVSDGHECSVKMFDETMVLKLGSDGNVLAKLSTDTEFYSLGQTPHELREKLTGDIFSHIDIFEEAVKTIVAGLDSKSGDLASVEKTHNRDICERAIKAWTGKEVGELQNVTNANVIDLAKNVVDKVRASDKAKDCFDDMMFVINKSISADRVNSEQAQELINAMNEDKKASDKVTIDEKFSAPKEGEPLPDVKEQGYRNLVADLIMPQDTRRMDEVESHRSALKASNAGHEDEETKKKVADAKLKARRQQFIDTIHTNKQALANLFTDTQYLCPRSADDAKNRNSGRINAMFDQVLTMFASDSSLLGLCKIKVTKDNVKDLSLAFGMEPGFFEGKDTVTLSELMLTSTGFFSLSKEPREGYLEALKNSEQLGKIKGYIEEAIGNSSENDIGQVLGLKLNGFYSQMISKIDEGFNAVQDEISGQIDATFKPRRSKKEFGEMGIDEMLEDALRPDQGGYLGFVKGVLKRYFKGMPQTSKLKMAAAGIRYGKAGSGDMDLLGAMLKGAGPLLQKILQGLDSKMLKNTGLSKAIEDMKSNLAPIPEQVVKAHLLDIVNRSGGRISKLTVKQTLGCASVAQAILCHAEGPEYGENGMDVVVKIVRPDALQGIKREKQLIEDIAAQYHMWTSYDGQIKSILEEFDFINEDANIQIGDIYNHGYDRVKSVKTIPLVTATSGTLIMERAPGSTVHGFIEKSGAEINRLMEKFKSLNADANTNDDAKREALEGMVKEYKSLLKCQRDLCDLAAKWVTEGLYGSGVFHGDLHSGNIMMDAEKGVTVIDFGNITKLTKEEQDAITLVAAAASCNSKDKDTIDKCAGYFIDGFAKLIPGGNADNIDREMIKTVLRQGNAEDAGKRILVIVNKLQQSGVNIPVPIFKFSQSQMRLQNTIEQFNQHIAKIELDLREAISGNANPLVEKLVNDSEIDMFQKSSKLETFPDRMGKVVMQNLWVTKKRVDSGLVKLLA